MKEIHVRGNKEEIKNKIKSSNWYLSENIRLLNQIAEKLKIFYIL